jgi:xanthine dehydrogenase molybdenum-binding subunit
VNTIPFIGTSHQRVDAIAKARGEHIYPSDFALAGMVWLRIVRSSKPHAKLLSVNTKPAEVVPGVVCVLTAADIPGKNGFGLFVDDQPVLAVDRVRFEGEPIAVVAAETDEIARKACTLVEVVYEDLPIVDDALTAETATPLHPGGNVCSKIRLSQGEGKATFDDCEVVAEISYVTNRQEHAFLETEAGTAWIDENGLLTLSVGGQNPFNDRRQVAAALGLPLDKVRVLNPMMGGAFGGKEDCNVQIPLALVTHKTGRPSRLMFDRRESLQAGVKRHSMHVKTRIGADSNGRLKVADVDLIADAGAYTTLSAAVIAQAAEHAAGPYLYDTSVIAARAIFTNNGNASAFRGFGNPQVVMGIEQAMDEISRRTGISPFDLRRKNLLKAGDMAPAGHVMPSDTPLLQMLDAAEKGQIWQTRDEFRRAGAPWVRRGVGMCALWQGYGLGAGIEKGASVHLHLTPTGKFRMDVGCPDLGSGNITAFLQIAADGLGTSPENLEYVAGDSLGPNSGSSHASRTMYVVGNSVAVAAREMRKRIAEAIGTDEFILDRDGIAAGKRRLSWPEVAKLVPDPVVKSHYTPPAPDPVIFGLPHAGYAYWVQTMAVEVDTLTGEVTIVAVENYTDTGKTINPLGALGQCEGAFTQGLGYALYENSIYKDGRLRNPTLSNYIIPSVRDMPSRLETTIFETPDPSNELGVRGIAEIGLTPVAATTANAVFDAIGVRFQSFPILPEMVLAVISSNNGR